MKCYIVLPGTAFDFLRIRCRIHSDTKGKDHRDCHLSRIRVRVRARVRVRVRVRARITGTVT